MVLQQQSEAVTAADAPLAERSGDPQGVLPQLPVGADLFCAVVLKSEDV